jgi:hypothetical protein
VTGQATHEYIAQNSDGAACAACGTDQVSDEAVHATRTLRTLPDAILAAIRVLYGGSLPRALCATCCLRLYGAMMAPEKKPDNSKVNG